MLALGKPCCAARRLDSQGLDGNTSVHVIISYKKAYVKRLRLHEAQEYENGITPQVKQPIRSDVKKVILTGVLRLINA